MCSITFWWFKASKHGKQRCRRRAAIWIAGQDAVVARKAMTRIARHEGAFMARRKFLPARTAMPGSDGGLNELPQFG
jgi:hypothetical protein